MHVRVQVVRVLCVCVCILDRVGSREVVSRAIVVVQMAAYLTSYSD